MLFRRRINERVAWSILGGFAAIAALSVVFYGVAAIQSAQTESELAAAQSTLEILQEERSAAVEKTAQERQEEAQERENERKRANRREAIAEVEVSIKTMASGHLQDGFIEGEDVISVTCVPITGNDIDNISQRTLTVDCFAATHDNGDGTMSGHYYNAHIDWDDHASYTYGPGRAG